MWEREIGVWKCSKDRVQWNLSNTDTLGPIKCVLIREMSSFQGVNNTHLYEFGTWSSILIREVSLIQGCPLREVPLYMYECKYSGHNEMLPCMISSTSYKCNHIAGIPTTNSNVLTQGLHSST